MSNPFEVIESCRGKAAVMKMKSDLLIVIVGAIKSLDMTQQEAASEAGIHQPRVSDLKNGRIDKFSVDSLIEIAARLGISFESWIERDNHGRACAGMTAKPEGDE